MAKAGFSEADWYADVFRRHEIAFRVQAQRLNLPNSMRAYSDGGVFHPGQEGYSQDPAHPAEDVLRSFALGLLSAPSELAAVIAPESKRLATEASEQERRAALTPEENHMLNFFEKNAWGLDELKSLEILWRKIISFLKKAYPHYFHPHNPPK